MRKILTLAAGLIMMTACAQKSQKAIVKSEPTTITWIEDKPGPTLQPQKLYPEVPDRKIILCINFYDFTAMI